MENNDLEITENNSSSTDTGESPFDSRSTAFISLRHLVKVYPNGEKAVYDFDLDIQKNEFIVIVGPSGCGKSTTLRMIAGLEDISSGEMYMQNELLNYKACKDRKMAIVFQSYALYPQFSVFDNIAFPLNINKFPLPVVNGVLEADAQIRKIIDKVPFNKLAGVLYNANIKHSAHIPVNECIAAMLNVSPRAGKILSECYNPFKALPLESFVSDKAEEYLAAVDTKLNELVSSENVKIQERGTKYDDDCREIDDNGNVKIEERKLTSYEVRKKVNEAAQLLDLVPYLDKRPRELSGGQMQRVALGRAIVKNVPVFLMDEPLSNLDAKLRLTMRSEIVKLHNEINATTIYVTHDQTEAMTMANRIVVMSRGFVQQIGTPEDVYNDPANIFVAKFIGSPSMNILEAEYDRQNNRLILGEVNIPLDKKFEQAHDSYYSDTAEKYRAMSENFDDRARELILKNLSATGEYSDNKKQAQKKKGFVALIKRFISFVKDKTSKKEKTSVDPYAFERGVCSEKLQKLDAALTENHEVLIGIRPERVKLQKCEQGKKYKDCLIVKPDAVELLGGEYNVHFTFCGKKMIGRIDAKDKITVKDDIAVVFSQNDMYIFDPIAGDVVNREK